MSNKLVKVNAHFLLEIQVYLNRHSIQYKTNSNTRNFNKTSVSEISGYIKNHELKLASWIF